ncbi:MAG: transglutaminase domain-containing protein [Deltaproteobacteria bacterium]|nr:transglutaminase domain-containing protein [Deltaproteobacteria bacterium]
MKRIWLYTFIIAAVCLSTTCLAASRADEIFREAERMESAHNLTRAADLYGKAMKLYVDSKEEGKAALCRAGYGRIQKITYEFPLTFEEAKAAIKETAPKTSEKRIDAWLKRPGVAKLTIDGKPLYFRSVDKNFAFRNPDVGQSLDHIQKKYRQYYDIIRKLIDDNKREVLTPGAVYPYKQPVVYQGKWTLTIERKKLPRKGTLQLWIPLPVLTGPQTDVNNIVVSPQKYVILPARIDTDLGLVPMSVPLKKLAENLLITVDFTFTHHGQRFRIDPANVGSYNVKSALYREYTASRGNTTFKWGIRERARKIVGDEVNPYKAARKIYDYVVGQVFYSFMPHYSLDARCYPESLYVHLNRYGDCGAQSSYFTALCRAVGIPARTTGGYQIIEKGHGSGHFWAEFYLPNYGWVPVDTSIAQVADYLPDLTDREKKEYKDYFFGNMDPYRLVIQKDIDIPLTPPAAEPIMLSMALQDAAALCDTMLSHPGFLVNDGWKYEVKEVTGREE